MIASLVRSVTAWKATLVWPLAAETPVEKFARPAGGMVRQPAHSTARKEMETNRVYPNAFFMLKHVLSLHPTSTTEPRATHAREAGVPVWKAALRHAGAPYSCPPCCCKNAAISGWLHFCARAIGVQPWLSTALIFAPCASSNSVISLFPF